MTRLLLYGVVCSLFLQLLSSVPNSFEKANHESLCIQLNIPIALSETLCIFHIKLLLSLTDACVLAFIPTMATFNLNFQHGVSHTSPSENQLNTSTNNIFTPARQDEVNNSALLCLDEVICSKAMCLAN
jgi:hypothetical protein